MITLTREAREIQPPVRTRVRAARDGAHAVIAVDADEKELGVIATVASGSESLAAAAVRCGEMLESFRLKVEGFLADDDVPDMARARRKAARSAAGMAAGSLVAGTAVALAGPPAWALLPAWGVSWLASRGTRTRAVDRALRTRMANAAADPGDAYAVATWLTAKVASRGTFAAGVWGLATVAFTLPGLHAVATTAIATAAAAALLRAGVPFVRSATPRTRLQQLPTSGLPVGRIPPGDYVLEAVVCAMQRRGADQVVPGIRMENTRGFVAHLVLDALRDGAEWLDAGLLADSARFLAQEAAARAEARARRAAEPQHLKLANQALRELE
jgi:hypothetical protein